MNAKVSLEMFIQICQYLSKNEGEFIRSIFYEILENQSS